MKPKIKKVITAAGLAVLLAGAGAVFTACESGLLASNDSSQISIQLGSGQGRTMLPEADLFVSQYNVQLTQDDTILSGQAVDLTYSSPELNPGTWQIAVEGINADGDALIFGQTSIELAAGQQKSVSLAPQPLSGSGTFVMQSFASIPDISVSLELADSNGVVTDSSSVFHEDGQALPSGYYTATVELSDSGAVVDTLRSAVLIAKGFTTAVTLSIDENGLLQWESGITNDDDDDDDDDDNDNDGPIIGDGLLPYSVNPTFGRYVPGGLAITGDASSGQWVDDEMLIAIDMANDDPRSLGDNWSMHETPWDLSHLWAAWDDEHVYIAWQYVDVTDIIDPANAGSSGGTRPLAMDLIQWIAIDTTPGAGSHYDMWGKNGEEKYWNGSDLPDYQIYVASNLTQGYISRAVDGTFVVNDDDETDDYQSLVSSGGFSHDEGIITNIEYHVEGFEIAAGAGLAADTLFGVGNADDALLAEPELRDFLDEGHDGDRDSFYEMKIPFSMLNIDREYIENHGIGVMLGQGEYVAIDTIPHDPQTLAYPGVSESNSPLSWEQEKTFTTNFARIGK